MDEGVGIGARRRLEAEAADLRLVHDPDEGNVGEGIIRIAAADIRVNACEPHLAQAFVADMTKSVRARLGQRQACLRPEHGLKRRAFVIQRQRVTRAIDDRAQLAIGQFERPELQADAARHFVDRQAIGGHRVPDADEADRLHRRFGDFGIRRPACDEIKQVEQSVAKQPDRVFPRGSGSGSGRRDRRGRPPWRGDRVRTLS